VQDALEPVNSTVKEVTDQIADFVKQSPDLTFPINGKKATSWLLTTFLDSVTPSFC